MNQPTDPLDTAVALHREGRLVEAATAYRIALRQYPSTPELHYNLGTILHSQGDLAGAEQYYRQAIAIRESFPDPYSNLGNIFKEQGKLDAAEQAYKKALLHRPEFAEAACNLGTVYELKANVEAALLEYRRAIQLRPNFAEAYFNLGLLLWRKSDREAAFEAMQFAVMHGPQFAEAHNQLGYMHWQFNRLDAAADCCRRACAIRPGFVEAMGNLANIVQIQGKLSEAVQLYQAIIQIAPTNPIAYNDLGAAYQEALQLKTAKEYFLKAIELQPDYPMAYCNLGGCCILDQDFEGAVAGYRKAIELKPDLHRAKMYLANQLQTLCRWDELDHLSKKIIQAVEADEEQHFIAPFSFIGLPVPTTAMQQLTCARNWSRSFVGLTAVANRFSSLNKVAPVDGFSTIPTPAYRAEGTKLRIGYMSADFRKHAVAYMLPELFERHDRERFEVYGYGLCTSDGSEIRKRIEDGVDVFRELQTLSHREAAEQIAADQIHVLVDLQGYTAYSRPDILAMRPAPIQVSYIGYPGSMGCDFIDYILADDYVVPFDQQAYYTEKLVYLPGCYQVNDSQHAIAEYRPSRKECDLPEEAFVFCSFNTSHKYTPAMFEIWMRLLRNVPNSVLWLAEKHASVREMLRQEAKRADVDPDRLIFAKIIAIDEHLARQPLADLFLDSYPYNAHATASIALRMGVPLVTLSGETFSTRVAGSLLRAIGLESLITRSEKDYETLAYRLATNKSDLQAVRQHLAQNLQTTHLFDGGWFAKQVEKAYRIMWERYSQGQPIAPLRIDE